MQSSGLSILDVKWWPTCLGGPHILASKNTGLSILDVMWWSCMNDWQCLEVLLMHGRGKNE